MQKIVVENIYPSKDHYSNDINIIHIFLYEHFLLIIFQGYMIKKGLLYVNIIKFYYFKVTFTFTLFILCLLVSTFLNLINQFSSLNE